MICHHSCFFCIFHSLFLHLQAYWHLLELPTNNLFLLRLRFCFPNIAPVYAFWIFPIHPPFLELIYISCILHLYVAINSYSNYILKREQNQTYSWEQRKLEDYIIEYHEVTTENNQYPALTSSRKGIFLQTEYFAGNQIASDDNTGYNIVPYGYFTYRHMSDDEIFHFNINDIVENGIVSTLYPVFTTNDKLDSRYLQYQLNYGYEFARFAVLQKQGGSRTYMYLSKLKQLSLTMPKDVEEQKKISGFLMELDNLITLQQREHSECILTSSMRILEPLQPPNSH